MSLNLLDFESKSATEILKWAIEQYGERAGLASSFGMEDMVLLDLLSHCGGNITLFTLDTGRLPEETLETIERARNKYGVTIKTYFPQKEA
ncbi:MAG: phosphoadenosine phosphosulfate reductase family protein, partial [Nitrospinaceae bacterium]|nr:phosphoadenosine phosphosulfate reductase family protein [Nitrospinaceae bacterium]NIR56721.1 phosphoadenosine phosphosulfate reductase family protein [Nitrospinaceae bacterium]NIS87170.1 phosphoadenosine phosphosulfate reductase family protein [Nitrospinaceae bacterium]NIT84039.1 phosphoadenosine phosphosulfate reductase family protein [Nitrospinaceae bacterium]NIU46222.1 phosphoadenosine phosphosulfate reductase family protein [Nitrospinaceae bacterium]